jgi:phosphoglycerol transferase MdoB-like AlkP superfamily enzyme
LRLVIFLKFKPATVSASDAALTFLVGLHRDVFSSLLSILPLLFWFFLLPNRVFAAWWHRALFTFGCFVWWLVMVFRLMIEFFFFDEFMSRFNTVAVDYLEDPHEVLINIWDSYPVVKVLVVCGLLALGWTWPALRTFRQMWDRPYLLRTRFLWLAGAIALCAGLSQTVGFRGPAFSQDRTLNEIADNGTLSFARASWTCNLDYAAFYKKISLDEAYQRARRMLAEPNAQFVGDGHDIRRKIAGDPNRPRLNVVILLEESLGSEFWGSLGRTGETLTPEMDKLATGEGILFTNIYASGNRTVRGFEGVLSSFPPLPGDSIVKRDRSDNIESIARLLKRDGYNTIFFYGGRGMFDSMRSYASRNGWDRFLEHNPPFHDDFPHPNFATVWGVSDEEVYARAIQEFHALNQTGKPFLGTIMSVSNHKPYTYPKGRIPEDPDLPRRTREKVVKYSDWCLGQFFQAAKKEAFWTNTVFVVVADHGARVYGSQRIPIHSYEIPLVILGPAVVKGPTRVPVLGCSLDVSPTVLGLIGRPYETLFFGRDLLHDPPEQNRALLNHNRDIGLYAQDRMVVLGLKKDVAFYEGDPKIAEIKPLAPPTPRELELEKDAIALYQVADDLYMNRRYHLDADSEAGRSR